MCLCTVHGKFRAPFVQKNPLYMDLACNGYPSLVTNSELHVSRHVGLNYPCSALTFDMTPELHSVVMAT